MTIIELFETFITNPTVLIIGAASLIEVAPIKFNPWSKLLKWIGDAINGDIRKDLAELKRDFEVTKANDMRWNILNFANSCRRGEVHGRDEWRHVMSQIAEYEDYTERKHINNGVIEEDSKYLRELYHERNMKNDFLYKGKGQ